MSTMIPTWKLTNYEQDILWRDFCPLCSGKIINSDRNVDFAQWFCNGCDTTFICE